MPNTWNPKAAPSDRPKKRPGWEGHGAFHHVPVNDSQEHLIGYGEKCPCKPQYTRHSNVNKFGDVNQWAVMRHNWFDEQKARLEQHRTGLARAKHASEEAKKPKPTFGQR